MVTVKYADLLLALEFVSSAPAMEQTAYLSLHSGEILLLASDSLEDDIPDDLDAPDRYLAIPHKNDLDLGKVLALRSAAQALPEYHERVQELFGHKGAYARFKKLLESRGALAAWYTFEAEMTEVALTNWCAANAVVLQGIAMRPSARADARADKPEPGLPMERRHGSPAGSPLRERAMHVQASIESERQRHAVVLTTDGNAHSIAIAPRESGFGSTANGGELLCLAVATCFCNDIYREARNRAIDVVRVAVEAKAEFGDPGAPANRLSYRVTVLARAPEADVRALILHTDSVAEVHNTLRLGMPVELTSIDAIAAGRP